MVSAELVGDWDVRIKTPIGTLAVAYTFTERNGVLSATATGAHETVPVTDIVCTGEHTVTWRQTVTRPMRLHLRFDIRVDRDRLEGYSRAGRLPRSVVSGVRRR